MQSRWKHKARNGLDAAVTAVTGDAARPTALVLALPREDGTLRTIGSTSQLARAAATELGRTLTPTGATRERWLTALPGTAAAATLTHQVIPMVVEVLVDVAVDNAVLRHPARYLRPRPDLDVPGLTSSA